MKTKLAKDLMIPLADYATVSDEATLFDAVIALEKAQQKFDRSKYHHRAVLIYDANKKIVGKINQLDILRALEPKYDKMGEAKHMSSLGFSKKFLASLLNQYSLLSMPMRDICHKASEIKIKNFMHTPSEGEYIDENATLDLVIHTLIMGQHQSLLVTREKVILGILRLTDVFNEISETMKSCNI